MAASSSLTRTSSKKLVHRARSVESACMAERKSSDATASAADFEADWMATKSAFSASSFKSAADTLSATTVPFFSSAAKAVWRAWCRQEVQAIFRGDEGGQGFSLAGDHQQVVGFSVSTASMMSWRAP